MTISQCNKHEKVIKKNPNEWNEDGMVDCDMPTNASLAMPWHERPSLMYNIQTYLSLSLSHHIRSIYIRSLSIFRILYARYCPVCVHFKVFDNITPFKMCAHCLKILTVDFKLALTHLLTTAMTMLYFNVMLYAMWDHYIPSIYVHFGKLSIFPCHIDDVSLETVDEHRK